MAEQQMLVVKGRREVEPPEGFEVKSAERTRIEIERRFELPAEVDVEKIEAKLEDGVLTVALPKKEEEKPKTITVKVA
jgi:HSP20 family protein